MKTESVQLTHYRIPRLRLQIAPRVHRRPAAKKVSPSPSPSRPRNLDLTHKKKPGRKLKRLLQFWKRRHPSTSSTSSESSRSQSLPSLPAAVEQDAAAPGTPFGVYAAAVLLLFVFVVFLFKELASLACISELPFDRIAITSQQSHCSQLELYATAATPRLAIAAVRAVFVTLLLQQWRQTFFHLLCRSHLWAQVSHFGPRAKFVPQCSYIWPAKQ